MAIGVETRTIQTPDGRDLCLELGGDEDGFPVFVNGGTPNSRHMYEPWLADASRRGIRLISYDRPGYGGSSATAGRSVADGAVDVLAITKALGIERLAMWGYSGGGPFTLGCAALLPETVVAAATLGSVAPYGPEDLDYFAGMGDDNVDGIKLYLDDPEASRKRGAKEREEMLQSTPEQVAEVLKTLLTPVDAAVLTGSFAVFMSECSHDGLAPGLDGWWDDGVAHMEPWGFDLDSIRVPVKIWHGRHDRFVPFQHGEWLAKHVHGAEAELSEEDGHLTLLVNRVGEVHDWLLRAAG
ncbi:MAG TPA: alpha/beta fold hydrolase [Candidatus Micrarchaeaceae archaeon]|nr:alpha/beta fold hydrolase [Candidatus Micrarchaeaceae archaeon]HVB13267.1 alpha/beta fold hydrolase [Candidatus Dormibacteraeota bacterium]